MNNVPVYDVAQRTRTLLTKLHRRIRVLLSLDARAYAQICERARALNTARRKPSGSASPAAEHARHPLALTDTEMQSLDFLGARTG